MENRNKIGGWCTPWALYQAGMAARVRAVCVIGARLLALMALGQRVLRDFVTHTLVEHVVHPLITDTHIHTQNTGLVA